MEYERRLSVWLVLVFVCFSGISQALTTRTPIVPLDEIIDKSDIVLRVTVQSGQVLTFVHEAGLHSCGNMYSSVVVNALKAPIKTEEIKFFSRYKLKIGVDYLIFAQNPVELGKMNLAGKQDEGVLRWLEARERCFEQISTVKTRADYAFEFEDLNTSAFTVDALRYVNFSIRLPEEVELKQHKTQYCEMDVSTESLCTFHLTYPWFSWRDFLEFFSGENGQK